MVTSFCGHCRRSLVKPPEEFVDPRINDAVNHMMQNAALYETTFMFIVMIQILNVLQLSDWSGMTSDHKNHSEKRQSGTAPHSLLGLARCGFPSQKHKASLLRSLYVCCAVSLGTLCNGVCFKRRATCRVRWSMVIGQGYGN